jgi:cytidylate kinase
MTKDRPGLGFVIGPSGFVLPWSLVGHSTEFVIPRRGAMPSSSLTNTARGAGLSGPPLHGFRGDQPPAVRLTRPKGLSVAISREAGARGTTVARKVGELLGWQVFDQESLDYLLQDDTARGQLLADVPDGAKEWAGEQLDRLRREQRLNADPETAGMVRLILTVAARGDVVIVGRGAGYVLPVETTLHARVVAPFESRVGYIAQWLRMTHEEAAAEVRARDDRRAKFLARTLFRDPHDLYAYDVVVNPARLGIEGAAQFIGWALRTKQVIGEIADSVDGSGVENGARS